MRSTLFQCFGSRKSVFVFVFTIFIVGMYGLYVMDAQGDRGDGKIAPMIHYKEASVEHLKGEAYSDDNNHGKEQINRRLQSNIQSRTIDRVNHVRKTSQSLSIQTDEPQVKLRPQALIQLHDHPILPSEKLDILLKKATMYELQQSIQNTGDTWSSSQGTSFGANKRQENTEIPSKQNIPEEMSSTAKLPSTEQDSSLIKRMSTENKSFQNISASEKSFPKQNVTLRDTFSTKPPFPSESSSQSSSSRNRFPNKQVWLDTDTRAASQVASPQPNEPEKERNPRFGIHDLQEGTILGRNESVTDVGSQLEKKVSPVLLGGVSNKQIAVKVDQHASTQSDYSTVDNGPHNFISDGVLDSFYGRKILSSNFTLIYNAVPKCGSRTLQVTVINLRRGRKRPLFKNIPPPSYCSTNNTDSRCIKSFYMGMPPFSFVRPHFPFVPLPSNYIMINMIRDPLERFISLYFFRIYGDSEIKGIQEKHDINECVQTNETLCDPRFSRSAMTFMCGVEPACRNTTRWTLEKAKMNVERYLVIGYLEDIDSMIKVLEVLVPNRLSGLYELYLGEKKATRRFKTKQKEPLSPKTIIILKQRLKLHYEFYDFIRTKFDHLKENLGVR